jgi:formate dehydrogenase iron-sulfur subunit
MVEVAGRKVEALRARGFQHAAVYDPPGVGGTHMMYVVPLGDKLSEYDLPANPTASPRPLAALNVMKKVGSWLFGAGILGAVLHYLTVGPETAPNADNDNSPIVDR